ncbi:MAG: TIM barrel protein [Candidatus Hodarchaeales archaeon]|jgi:sugar phosphate isomerase/epimerase
MTRLGIELTQTKFRKEGGNRYSRRILEIYGELGVELIEIPVHRFLPALTGLDFWNRFYRINETIFNEFEDILSSYNFVRTAHALSRLDITNIRHQRLTNTCLQIADGLNCEKTVFHTSKRFFTQKNPEKPTKRPFLSQDGYSTRICLENMEPHFDPHAIQQWAHEHNLGFCFDVGHFSVSPGWEYDIMPKLMPDHLHAHNNDHVNDSHAPIDQGITDFERVFKMLGKIPDTTIMELHVKGNERAFYDRAWEAAKKMVFKGQN